MGALRRIGQEVSVRLSGSYSARVKGIEQLNPKQYASCLMQCETLEDARRLHVEILNKGHGGNPILGNILVHIYSKFDCLHSARAVFDSMGADRNVITWNTMVAAYSKKGNPRDALELFKKMDVEADLRSFTTVFGACGSLKSLADGREVHRQYTARGFSDVYAENSIVSMYCRCGSLDEARTVFDSMAGRNVVSWNGMITAYAKNGHFDEALHLLRTFDLEGLKTDAVTFIGILGACCDLRRGKEMQERALGDGFLPHVALETAVLNMYARCGSLHDTKSTFDRMEVKDVASWNAMLAAYDQFGQAEQAVTLYRRMLCEGVQPDAISYVVTLTACCNSGMLLVGKEIHTRFVSTGMSNHIVSNALINLHGKLGSLDDALKVFEDMKTRDVGSWNAMIGAYAVRGRELEALELYRRMDTKPDVFTFTIVIGACSSLGDLQEAEKLHADIVERRITLDMVTKNSLVTMYARCGSMEAASRAFEGVQKKEVSSWNSLIAGYTQQGRGKQAVVLFRKMDLEGVQPNVITFINVVTACAISGATIEECRLMQARVVAYGYTSLSTPDSEVLENALINMFARRGSLEKAKQIFEGMKHRNDGAWNAIIAAFAQHGHSAEALDLFLEMKLEGGWPCYITLCSVLLACSHAGLQGEAWYHFTETSVDYEIRLVAEHYHCMVDLLGRVGELQEAEQLMVAMPWEAGASGWRGLLNACRTHGDPKLAATAALRLSSMDPLDSSPYVLFSSLTRARAKI